VGDLKVGGTRSVPPTFLGGWQIRSAECTLHCSGCRVQCATLHSAGLSPIRVSVSR